jgi:hypothetical protein
MAPPVAVKKPGLAGKGKPDVRSLKRKRVTEDYEKLQRDVQELVSYCRNNVIAVVVDPGEGPESNRY